MRPTLIKGEWEELAIEWHLLANAVGAHGEPSARETDPIIGLSQKRIYFNSVALLFVIPVDFSATEASCP
jgi:hypothetical protein